MAVNVEELRKKYPNPKSAADAQAVGRESYCVGGALWRELRMEKWNIREDLGPMTCTPSPPAVALALRVANPNLAYAESCHIADQIVYENDSDNFDVAWAWMDKALSV